MRRSSDRIYREHRNKRRSIAYRAKDRALTTICTGTGKPASRSADGVWMKCPECGLCTIPYPNGTVRRHGPLPAKRIDAENEVARLRAEVTRLSSALQQAQTWQPISSAPKDADVLLLYLDGSGVQPGWWETDGQRWIAVETQSLTYGGWHSEPTHWMPLPAPPAGDAAPSTPNKN